MKIIKVLGLAIVTALITVSCANDHAISDMTTECAQATVSFEKSSEQISPGKGNVNDYKLHEIAPVTKDGNTVALLTLNQVQRLGIFDWTSSEAVDSGIKYSYTFNFKISYLQDLANGELVTFYLAPKFIDKSGKTVGNPCIVGWSGFPDTAVFTSNATDAWVEYGVQPIKPSKKAVALVVELSDSLGNQYDPIVYSKGVIKNAEKGPSLLTGESVAKITGASGAKLTIGIRNVYLEECFSQAYDFRWESDVDEVEKVPVLTFNYYITYDGMPTKKIEVSNIDTSTGEFLLNTDLRIGAQSNVGNTLYYDRNVNLTRFAFSDSLKLEKFVSATRYKVHEGAKSEYCENREVSAAVLYSSTSVRFRIEFSSDALVLSPEKLMKFNGRFIVFDKKIVDRKPKKESSGKRPYAAHTTDKKKIK